MRAVLQVLIVGGPVVAIACGGGKSPPCGGSGEDRSAKTAALEAGASLLQAKRRAHPGTSSPLIRDMLDGQWRSSRCPAPISRH